MKIILEKRFIFGNIILNYVIIIFILSWSDADKIPRFWLVINMKKVILWCYIKNTKIDIILIFFSASLFFVSFSAVWYHKRNIHQKCSAFSKTFDISISSALNQICKYLQWLFMWHIFKDIKIHSHWYLPC